MDEALRTDESCGTKRLPPTVVRIGSGKVFLIPDSHYQIDIMKFLAENVTKLGTAESGM